MPTFYRVLANALIVSTTNNFVWFALTFWVYLETRSVVSTGMVAGIYLVATAGSGFWLGSIVDHYKKKLGMLFSSFVTLTLFTIGFLLLILNPASAFASVTSPTLWAFIAVLLSGVIAGNIYGIAVPTLVTVLVPEDRHDKTNGMFGTVMGISFAITSVASGFVLAYGGMFWVLLVAMAFTSLAIVMGLLISIPEKKLIHTKLPESESSQPEKKNLDIKGTIKAVAAIPGLFPLIFFNTFNNFLGGVFMALMDAYGLTLMSVQAWGTLFGFLSIGFIAGGLLIAKKGLGKNPLKTLFMANLIMWVVCILFTIQASIILLTIGMLIWICLVPFIEASEQTIIQKVVPPERQGRVFGFAHSVEQSASPVTAFIIGPIAQFIFIPFMTTGAGVYLIGDWFGVGVGRGIALVFIMVGIIGLAITLLAMNSKYYSLLTKRYLEA